MSSVIIAGSTSGTVTIQAAPVAGSTTVTLANQTGTLNAAAPAFRAVLAATQSISISIATKVTLSDTLNSQCFDTNNCFSSSRFTPTVAGYYQINAMVGISVSTSIGNAAVYIYKNGSLLTFSFGGPASTLTGYASVSGLTYMNGTTDYIELYARGTGTGSVSVTDADFSAALVRGV